VDVLTARAGYHAMETICSRHKPPFGVFVVNDDVAMGVLIYCRHHGLSLPDQVAVVGFSDIALLEILDIPLTSIHIPQEQMGALTAQTLLDLIEHPEHRLAPKIQTLPVSLVIRGSTVVRPKTEEREPEFLPDSPG
jgi:DNA-binding LacI/PurR family transcriptional regulator